MTIQFFSDRKLPDKKKLLRFAGKICRELKKLQEVTPLRVQLREHSRALVQREPIDNGEGEISVVFVSDRQIRKLNQTYFKKNRATDVIAFPYFSHESWVMRHALKNKKSLLKTHDARLTTHDRLPFGDIYISIDTAKGQARAGKHSLSQELALLLLHGLLHLVGYEDSPPAKKKKMFQMQKKLFLDLAPTLAPPDILQ